MDQYRNNGEMTFDDKGRFRNIRRQQNPDEHFSFEKGDLLTHPSSLTGPDSDSCDTVESVTAHEVVIRLKTGKLAKMSQADAVDMIRSRKFFLWKLEKPAS